MTSVNTKKHTAKTDQPVPEPTPFTVWVPGRSRPQGSKTGLPYRKANGKLGVRQKESSAHVGAWREKIAWFLHTHVEESIQDEWPLPGPLSVTVTFVMPRPANTPKDRTPPAIRQPDIDKTLRAVLDAGSKKMAAVWFDDSQVIETLARKRRARIGEEPGVWITVRGVPEGEWESWA